MQYNLPLHKVHANDVNYSIHSRVSKSCAECWHKSMWIHKYQFRCSLIIVILFYHRCDMVKAHLHNLSITHYICNILPESRIQNEYDELCCQIPGNEMWQVCFYFYQLILGTRWLFILFCIFTTFIQSDIKK